MTNEFPWQEKYAEALLELGCEELPRRIDAAERAIHQRIEELKYDGFKSAKERCAIDDALRGLRVLARTESQRQPSTGAGGPPNEVAP